MSHLAKFQSKHPEWKGVRSYIIFRDHFRFNAQLYLDVSKILDDTMDYSFLKAPFVMQYYIRRNKYSNIEYFKKLPPRVQHNLVYHNHGWSALKTLKHICGDVHHRYETVPVDKLPEYIINFGPGLVTDFHNPDLKSQGQTVYINGEKPSRIPESPYRHSMLIVGFRYTPENEVRFLVQNWWKKKPFFETSADYLKASGVKITFITFTDPLVISFYNRSSGMPSIADTYEYKDDDDHEDEDEEEGVCLRCTKEDAIGKVSLPITCDLCQII